MKEQDEAERIIEMFKSRVNIGSNMARKIAVIHVEGIILTVKYPEWCEDFIDYWKRVKQIIETN